TGIFQPADVGMQRITKHRLAQEEVHFLIKSHKSQTASGLTPEQVKITTSYPVLRDATVMPIVQVFEFMRGPYGRDIVKKAWERCVANEWNLSEAVLTSRKARASLRNYLLTDKILRDEIEGKMGPLNLGLEPEDDEDPDEDDTDDTDVPSSAVINEALGIVVPPSVVDSEFCVDSGTTADKKGRLHAIGEEEDIWSLRYESEDVLEDSL
ncbi:hypothetical protein EWM64_g9597, partial [Hericium alpestre]